MVWFWRNEDTLAKLSTSFGALITQDVVSCWCSFVRDETIRSRRRGRQGHFSSEWLCCNLRENLLQKLDVCMSQDFSTRFGKRADKSSFNSSGRMLRGAFFNWKVCFQISGLDKARCLFHGEQSVVADRPTGLTTPFFLIFSTFETLISGASDKRHFGGNRSNRTSCTNDDRAGRIWSDRVVEWLWCVSLVNVSIYRRCLFTPEFQQLWVIWRQVVQANWRSNQWR